jgi:integrase
MRNDQKPLPCLPRGAKAPTLGDVRDVVQNSAGLSAVRIRDLISAITCFCGLIGQEPDCVPLDLAAIREKLNAINPVANGISAKRLANIRSDLFAAITASKLKPVTPPRQSLTEPWRTLRAMLKTERHRIGISRFSHYASTTALTPTDVDDEVMTDFITAVREESLHRKPNDLHRKTTVIWNEIVRAFPELDLRPVSVPSYRAAPRRIDLSLLSDSFKNDMEAYLAWCASTDPFTADARPRPLAPATIRLRRDQIHAAVTALVESGITPESITTLADLVTAPNFKRIAQRRLEMADGNTNSFNRGLAGALVQAAKEWVKTDAAALTELKRLASKLPAPRGDLTAKNKRFLRQFDDPVVLQRLRALPAKLWSKVRRDKSGNFRILSLAQAALALEILIFMPIRMQNLARLEFDRHLFLRDGPGAVSTLDIPADEVKNKRPIEFDIPPHIARMLIDYRDHIIPKILGHRPDRLFVNPEGTPKHPQSLSKLIRRIVRRYAGADLSPHQLRHLAAKILLDDSPGAFELVKQLLGHENLKTTVNAYAGIDTRRACRHHFQLLEKISADEPISVRHSGRRRHPKPKKPDDKSGRD